MSSKKNTKIKGTVLYTVVSVMAILTVMIFASMTLAASANRRAHNNYANNQTQYTARSVVDALWGNISNSKSIMDKVKSLGEGRSLNIDVSGIDRSMGELTGAYVEHIKGDKFKLVATVKLLGQENTVAGYFSTDEPRDRMDFEYGIVTLDKDILDNVVAYGGSCLGVEPHGGSVIQNACIINSPLNANGDLKITQAQEMNLSTGTGIVAMGNIEINNLSKINSIIAEPGIEYRKLPYIFAYQQYYGSYHGGRIEYKETSKVTIGGEGDTDASSTGTEDGPVMVIAQSISVPKEAPDAIYGDVYLLSRYADDIYDTNNKCDVSSYLPRDGVHPWTNGSILKKRVINPDNTESAYTGGNVYSLGYLNYEIQNDATIANNIVVGKKFIFKGALTGKEIKTTGMMVTQKMDISSKNNFEFQKGLFVDPRYFVCPYETEINGVKYMPAGVRKQSFTYQLPPYYTKEGFKGDEEDGYNWGLKPQDEAKPYTANQKTSASNYTYNNFFKKNDFLTPEEIADLAQNPRYVLLDTVSINWRDSKELVPWWQGTHYNGETESGYSVIDKIQATLNIKKAGSSDNLQWSQKDQWYEVKDMPVVSASVSKPGGQKETVQQRVWTASVSGRPNNISDMDQLAIADSNDLEIVLSDLGGNYYNDPITKERKVQYCGNQPQKPIRMIADSITMNANIYSTGTDAVVSYLKEVNDVAFTNNGNVLQIDDIDKAVRLTRTGSSPENYKYKISVAQYITVKKEDPNDVKKSITTRLVEEGKEIDAPFVTLKDSSGNDMEYTAATYKEFIYKVLEYVTYPESMGLHQIYDERKEYDEYGNELGTIVDAAGKAICLEPAYKFKYSGKSFESYAGTDPKEYLLKTVSAMGLRVPELYRSKDGIIKKLESGTYNTLIPIYQKDEDGNYKPNELFRGMLSQRQRGLGDLGFANDTFLYGNRELQMNNIRQGCKDKIEKSFNDNDSDTKSLTYNFNGDEVTITDVYGNTKTQSLTDPSKPLTVTDSCTFTGDLINDIFIEPASDAVYIKLSGFSLDKNNSKGNVTIVVNDKRGSVYFLIPTGGTDDTLTICGDILTQYYWENKGNPIHISGNPLKGSKSDIFVDSEKIPGIYYYVEYNKDKSFNIAVNNGHWICGYIVAPTGKVNCTATGSVIPPEMYYHFDTIPCDMDGNFYNTGKKVENEIKNTDGTSKKRGASIIGGVICGEVKLNNHVFVGYVNPNPKDENGNVVTDYGPRMKYYQLY